MAQTEREYYENKELFGGYQFLTLKNIVDEILIETTDPDSYLKNTKRSKILVAAKNGIRELNKAIKKTVFAMEITVGPKLYVPLPQDYVDWVRLSIVMPDFKVKPLRKNNKMQTAIGYLQDNEYRLLYDNEGRVIKADSSNVINKKFNVIEFCGDYGDNGEFVIDEERGIIAFSSNIEGREIVIEYISDGLQKENIKEEEITIHKDLKMALEQYIYMSCISKRASVPANEKRRAKNEFLATLHKVKIDKADFDINEISRIVTLSSKIG